MNSGVNTQHDVRTPLCTEIMIFFVVVVVAFFTLVSVIIPVSSHVTGK